MNRMSGDKVHSAMKAHAKRVDKPQTFCIATLPDAYGYGVWGVGKTPEEAEKACRNFYFKVGRHGPNSGWQHRPWKEAKEEWGFHISQVTTGKGYFEGEGD